MGIANTKHRLFSNNDDTPATPPPPPPPPPVDNQKALTTTAKKNQNQVVPKRSPLLAVYALTPTTRGFFRRPFAPLSPAQHIKAVLARWHGTSKANATAAAAAEGEEGEENVRLNKNFGFLKHIRRKYELGDEVGRGHFGHTCKSKFKYGELKGQQVAIKIIPKSKMTTSIAIEDVKREVKILRLLTGHSNLVTFYDAYEDHDNVYLVMELCEGGVLLDRIIARGGKYTEDDARKLMIQMLTVVAFCHLQGVVHRDLKPENFLFASKDEDAELKAIDFGLSDFVNPEERLDDIVGSAYYVAPEVLQRSYGTEADVWSVGIIAYALLCGSRPFWGRTESGIFRAVLKNEPTYDDASWSNLSILAKHFVKTLLNKDPKKRLTAAQALCHPWIRNGNQVKKAPFDIWIPKFVKRYICSSNLRKSALRALSKTLNQHELVYLKEQFSLLEPTKGYINVESFKTAVTKYATGAMKESCINDFLESVCKLQYKKMDFEEFCAATVRVHQIEGRDGSEEQIRAAYDIFERDGNRSIMVEELASELGLGPSIPVRDVLDDLIRPTDGKLTYLGFVKVLRGHVSRRNNIPKP